jgi:DNA-binding NarL/FixJ family response regulator
MGEKIVSCGVSEKQSPRKKGILRKSQGKYMFESAGSEIRVLIVDDHPVVRYGLIHMLESETDIEVVGELDDVRGIGEVLSELRPEVVLPDLELGDLHGVDALRRVREEAPELHVIICTSHDEEERIIQAAQIGVDGYL